MEDVKNDRKKSNRRNAGKVNFWKQHLVEWQTSGLNVSRYCRLHDLSESLFYRWKREIPKREAEKQCNVNDQELSGQNIKRSQFPIAAVPPRFVEVRLTESSQSHGSTFQTRDEAESPNSGPIEVVLPNSRILRVRSGFDRRLLLDVIGLLESEVELC